MAAMLRTVKASPGCRPRVTDGQQRESEQANTMYCSEAITKRRKSASPAKEKKNEASV
jgi:hypothetical protein